MQHKNNKSNSQLKGIITITRSGTGFFMHEDLEDDIRIERDNLNTALSGDTVLVLKLPKGPRDSRFSGKVLEVVERSRTQFVGTLDTDGGVWKITPDNPRVYRRFVVEGDTSALKVNDKALIELTTWDKSPNGKIIEIIGKKGGHETEIRAILLERGFASGFTNDVEEEARALLSKRAITEEDLPSRADFRDTPTFTIDPDDAKDFDDALSIKELPNGNYEVGIHIADVTHYVLPGSAIEKEAQNRATSVYLVDRTIPMLPEAISNDLCSLNPNEDKRAFAAIFELNSGAGVVNVTFAKTLINSDQRFTYRTAQDVLDGGDHKYAKEVNTLWDLSSKLRKRRVEEGAIEFESDEIQFELDESGKPLKAYIKEKLDTMKLIEEFMLLTNRTIAKHLAEKSQGNNPASSMSIYRIHESPDSNKLAELSVFLKALGYNQLNKEAHQIKAKDLGELMRAVKGRPEEAVVQMATLRSMAKAIYSDKNIGHFSLGFSHYTNFTSPIRRYPDMMIHRILMAHIDNSPIPKEEIDTYRSMALRSSQREVEAVRAERDSTKFKQVEYMHSKVGDVFDGKVTGVTKGGMFVSENSTHAEGMVRLSSLSGWFELDEKHYALVNKKDGKKYRIGDDVKIKLKKADVEARELDWEVV